MVSTDGQVSVQSSNNAKLQCTFTGYLPTYYEIIWTNNMTGSPINDSFDQYDIDERETQGQSQRGGDNLESGILSELTIISATTDDEGVYTCSINGSTLIGTVQLFVTGKLPIFRHNLLVLSALLLLNMPCIQYSQYTMQYNYSIITQLPSLLNVINTNACIPV